jgi:hypothetical protein
MKKSIPDTDSGSSEPQEHADGISQEEIDRLLQNEQLGDELSLSEAFEILQNKRRRDVLRHLAASEDNTTTLSELAEHVAAKENDIDRSELSSTQRKRVYIGLYQCHLPKMDDLGVVDYDQDRGTVELQNGAKLLSYLPESGKEHEQSRVPLYAALAVSGLLTVGPLVSGTVATLPTVVWSLLGVVSVAAVGAYLAGV